MRFYRQLVLTLSLLVILTPTLSAQQDKPTPLPPINPSLARLEQTASGLDGPGFAIAFSKKTGLLIAACDKPNLRYWRKDVSMGVRVGDRPPNLLQGHEGPVLAVDARGGTVASAGVRGKLLIWKLPEATVLHTIETGVSLRCLAVSPDGKQVATTGDDGIVQLWDATTARPGITLKQASDWLLALAFSPDGKTIAAGGFDGSWHIWDLASGKMTREGLAQPPAPAKAPPPPVNVVRSLAFSPDGKILAVGGSDARIHFFQPADGKLIRSLTGHTSAVTALTFHPEGKLLVSSSKDHTLKLWNPANGQMMKTLEGHTSWVQDVTFLIQGTRLASVGADQTVRLWDLTDPNMK